MKAQTIIDMNTPRIPQRTGIGARADSAPHHLRHRKPGPVRTILKDSGGETVGTLWIE